MGFYANWNVFMVDKQTYEELEQRVKELESNISNLSKAVEVLRETEERHRSLLESSPDPIVVYDIEGRATYINPAFSQTFGWSPDELLGKHIDFVPEENWPETEAAIRHILQGKKVKLLETKRFTKDGRILSIQLSSSLFLGRDGKPAGNIVIFRDITARKHAEEALQESKRRYHLLAENVTDLVWEMDMNLRFTYASPSVTRILGYSVTEIMEMRLEGILTDDSRKIAEKVFSGFFLPRPLRSWRPQRSEVTQIWLEWRREI